MSAERDVKCFVRFVYLPQSLWSLQQFLECLGKDFDNPPEAADLQGLKGRACFELDSKGYLEPVEFYAAAPGVPGAATEGVPDNDNLPF